MITVYHIKVAGNCRCSTINRRRAIEAVELLTIFGKAPTVSITEIPDHTGEHTMTFPKGAYASRLRMLAPISKTVYTAANIRLKFRHDNRARKNNAYASRT